MRKLLFIAIALFAWLGAAAQGSKQLININQSSFRAEQKGMIEDVNIDPIAKDRSKRPCARIKMHVNRMTRDDIDRLQVFTAGGNVELTKRVINFEGNGLILEMTAKPQTRFYLHHDKYGDSNEVTVDLEGDKVYLMDAQLDLLLTVVVASNVKGADVYIDNQYKGVIGESYMLSVEGVTPGEHKIKIQHGAATAEQTVNVNNGNISFRVEVNDESSQPQYVVFELQPTHAMLFIDNEPQATQEGFVTAVLQNGTYNYRVIAKGYHEQSGTFTVSGERVVRKVTLKADAAMVTLTTDPSAEIWINNQKRGTGSWSGQLTSGTYIFEARKEGHHTTRLSQVITSAQATQSYKLATPTPIEGSLNITSVPALASVKVDGKVMGDAPLATKLLVGRHTIEVSKSGYGTWRKEVTIAEGQTATVAATLTKASVPAVRTTTTKGQPAQGPYKVGDYYDDGKKQGVVFWVDSTGKHGKIVSLTESKTRLPWVSNKKELKKLIGTDDKENGVNNTARVRRIPDWQSKYPAFKWCTDLGEGWYLPAIEELKLFTLDETIRNTINQTLTTKGGTEIPGIGMLNYWYWSSTESNEEYNGMFCAWGVSMSSGNTDTGMKYSDTYVRAVSAF